MASTSASGNKRKTIAPSASSSVPKLRQRPPYDIFINHRGPDVKHTLAASLYSTLTGMSLSVFLDFEELESCDLFPVEIETAIASAMLHIAIFSQSYANSPSCLAELSFMLETGAKIIPIFYRVKPSDLRWVDQGEYAEAFKDHERKGRYSPRQLQKWKNALHKVSFYVGHIIDTNEDETRLLKNIVSCVLQEIKNEPFLVAKHPVGMEEIVEDFNVSTLQSAHNSQDVRIVGIWGMGGSGKTTLAKAIYNDMRSSMERSSFLSDVGDAATKGLLLDKQKNLLNDLGVQNLAFDNVEEGMRILTRSLSSFRVLIVCDNVDDMEQLAVLLPGKHNLQKGSLVIVTAQEVEVIKSWGISSIYKMKPLDPFHAKQLFCWHAFSNPYPPHEFEELVEKFLKLCKGLPSSLEVLGRQLYGESQKEIWEKLWKQLLYPTDTDIQNILQESYDILDNEEKEMFLDIACFFIGQKSWLAIEVWNAMGWSGLHGLRRLLNNCLVELDNNNLIRMHVHLRDLGREIANKQSPNRLWLPQQIINVKKQEKNNIRGINFVPTEIGEWRSSGDKYMANIREEFLLRAPSLVGLKLLVIRGDFLNQVVAEVLRELLWLRWFQSGQRIIPAWLSLKYLRVLELYEDSGGEHQLEELWDEDSDHPLQLRELVISDCHKLRRFPNSIGSLMHLKRILITSGINLLRLPEEFCRLQSLEHLQLCDCVMLLSLPSGFGDLRRLRHLDLSNCKNLKRLPNSFKNLTILLHHNLQGCGQLTLRSEDFENITKLEFLNLSWCEQLEELPRHVTKQVFLRELYLNNMKKLSELPLNIAHLGEMLKMSVGSDLLAGLPDELGHLSSLAHLSIKHCHNLSSLPDSLGNLSSLTHLLLKGCHILSSLPDSLGDLSSLAHLSIKDCHNLSSLPDSLGNLSSLVHLLLKDCHILKRLPDSLGDLSSLAYLSIKDCYSLSSLPDSLGNLSSLTYLLLKDCYFLSSLPDSLGNLTSLTQISIERCHSLLSLPDSLGNLSSLIHLSTEYCHILNRLPDFLRQLSSLTYLSTQNCHNLEYCPSSLGVLSSLTNLIILNSPELLPDYLEQLTKLEKLYLLGFPHRNLPWLQLRNLLVLELHGADEMEELWENEDHAPLQLRELIITGTWSASFQRFPSSISYLSNLKSIALLGDAGKGFGIEELPEKFSDLRSLEHLELRYCTLLSSLPGRFGDLRNLRHLNLSYCKALRILPVSFQQLKLLNYLDLSGCKRLVLWKDVLENIRQLENLYLSGCLALQKMPHQITDQACLRELHLQNTYLEDLPSDIGQLSKLEVLTIGSSLLKSLPDSLGNLSSLRSLSITNCFTLKSLPKTLGHLALLEHLCIEATGVSYLPEGFRRLGNLGTLKISDCPLRDLDFGLVSSFSLEKLMEINLSETLVTRISISGQCCPRLETLRLRQNDNLEVIETLPETIKNIEFSECEMLKNIKAIHALPVHPKLTISDCPELEKSSEFGFLEIEKQLEKKGSVELVSKGSSEGDIDSEKPVEKEISLELIIEGSSEYSEVEKRLKKKRAVHLTVMSDSE